MSLDCWIAQTLCPQLSNASTPSHTQLLHTRQIQSDNVISPDAQGFDYKRDFNVTVRNQYHFGEPDIKLDQQ